jgi:hypothetical protein
LDWKNRKGEGEGDGRGGFPKGRYPLSERMALRLYTELLISKKIGKNKSVQQKLN